MKILVFGATGMVGEGVLRECLRSPDVSQVVAIGRRATGQVHPKLTDLVHADLFDYRAIEPALAGFDGCFFCLGVSSVGMAEADYTRVTFDLTLAAARTLARLDPGLVFTYVSGTGTDSTERGRTMWARVKGRTENALAALPFRGVYLFRPGLIQPLHGAVSKTRFIRVFYRLLGPLWSLARRLAPRQVVTTEQVGQAMLAAVRRGAGRQVLEPADIQDLAAPTQA